MNLLQTQDIAFLVVYFVEFVVKVYAEPIRYWMHMSHRFDFVILLITLIQVRFLHSTDCEQVFNS